MGSSLITKIVRHPCKKYQKGTQFRELPLRLSTPSLRSFSKVREFITRYSHQCIRFFSVEMVGVGFPWLADMRLCSEVRVVDFPNSN